MSIKLDKIDTLPPDEFHKKDSRQKTKKIIKEMGELINLLFAEKKHSLLIILQGMDASGKDGVLRKVFGNFNPRNLNVHSFDVPTEEEAAHDFLWRVHQHTPAKGMIQLFNRSHYDSVVVTRVLNWCSDEKAIMRMNAINHFEQLLQEDNCTVVLKFYLHVSQKKQEKRMQERVDTPSKHWKFNAKDYQAIAMHDEYAKMYEDVFKHCNDVPWIIVPSDKNWYKEYVVATTVYETLQSLNMKYPPLPL